MERIWTVTNSTTKVGSFEHKTESSLLERGYKVAQPKKDFCLQGLTVYSMLYQSDIVNPKQKEVGNSSPWLKPGVFCPKFYELFIRNCR